MLTSPRAISWRRKLLRWRRRTRCSKPLLAATSLSLVLTIVFYQTLLSPTPPAARAVIIPMLTPIPPPPTTQPNPRPALAPLPDNNNNDPSPAESPTSPPSKAALHSDTTTVDQKRQAVKSAVLHAWSGYKRDAFGHDELLPLSHSFTDNWGSLSWTLIDSIGTLFLCGLTHEYTIARDFIARIRFDRIDSDVSVFETNIRILGGLLSAFELSGDYMFVQQARHVGDALMPAFATGSGFPSAKINLATGRQSASWVGDDTVILSEIGSLQMEFAALSQLTGDAKFMRTALRVYERLNKIGGGLLPTRFSLSSGHALNDVRSVGAFSDSYYEYLLKLYILSDRTVPAALDMYIKAVDEIVEQLVIEWVEPQTKRQRARIVRRENGKVDDTMDHLSCFVPGMLALGAYYGERHGIDSLLQRKDRHMQLAVSLLDTCLSMYSMTATKLAPEYINYEDGEMKVGQDRRYLLRPETVESLFVLYRITGNETYRDAGWDIFTSIEKHCRTDTAYAAVEDVDSNPAVQLNNMESFVMAETFKYLYLLFSPDTVMPLDHFVFTTEAHPLRIMTRSAIKLSVE